MHDADHCIGERPLPLYKLTSSFLLKDCIGLICTKEQTHKGVGTYDDMIMIYIEGVKTMCYIRRWFEA